MEYLFIVLCILIIGVSMFFIIKTQKRNKKEGMLTSYKVIYLGGAPDYPKRIGGVDLFVMPDCFIISKNGNSFSPIKINYTNVSSFDLVARGLTAGEAIVVSPLTKNQVSNIKNHMHINYINNSIDLTLRLEMFTGGQLSRTAVQCDYLVDFLKVNNIYQKFQIRDRINSTK